MVEARGWRASLDGEGGQTKSETYKNKGREDEPSEGGKYYCLLHKYLNRS